MKKTKAKLPMGDLLWWTPTSQTILIRAQCSCGDAYVVAIERPLLQGEASCPSCEKVHTIEMHLREM